MQFVWRYLSNNVSKLLFATLLSTLSGLGVIFIMRTFHSVVKNGIEDPTQLFISVALGLIGFIVFGLLSEKVLFKLSNQTILQMRIDFCQLIFKSEYEEVEGKKKELFSSLVSDINALSRIIEKLPGANRNLVISLAGLIYLTTISWELTLIMLGFFLITYLVILRRNVLAYHLTMAARKSWDAIYYNIHDIIYGIKELSLNSSRKKTFINKHLRASGQIQAQDKVRLRLFNQVTNKISESIMIVSICTMISLTFFITSVTMESFAEFLAISLFIINPLSSVSHFTKEMVPLKALTNHIEEIGIQLEKAKEDISEDTVEIPETDQRIILRDIEYTYSAEDDDHHFHLGPISIEIPPKEITLIYGSNGSGKTTLSKILAGLYKAENGKMNYGETLIDRTNLQSYRDRVSAVFSDNHLFKNNEINHEDIPRMEELLKVFSIEDRVSFEGNELQEKGLSTGQAKRLALVLSMIDNKEIYIFDEWAANQDPAFKKAFYNQLIPDLKKRGKTIILITHDDQYFHIADHKIHLSDGKIV